MAPKTKKKNFTCLEIEVLLTEIHKRKAVIFSSVSSGIKGPAKGKEWEKITSPVNAVSSVGRTATEIKKKKMVRYENGFRKTACHGKAFHGCKDVEDVPLDTDLQPLPECEDMATYT